MTTVILLLGLGKALPAVAEQQVFYAKYKGKYSGLSVEFERTLSLSADGVYQFHSAADNLFGSIEETSHFAINSHTIQPQSYRYARSIFGKKKTETVDFDHANNTATYRENQDEKVYEHPLDKTLSDPALYQLLIQHDFKDGAQKADYYLVKRSRIKHYAFKRLDDATVKIGKKDYPAIVVERLDDDKSKRTRAWLIPALDYTLGKLEHTDDGDTHTMTLVEYRVDHAALRQFHSQL